MLDCKTRGRRFKSYGRNYLRFFASQAILAQEYEVARLMSNRMPSYAGAKNIEGINVVSSVGLLGIGRSISFERGASEEIRLCFCSPQVS